MNQGFAYLKTASRHVQEPSVNRQFLVRLARGAVFALVIQTLGSGLGYLSQVAFARWMGVSQFGVYAYVIAWATILALLTGLGFPLSVLRFIPEYRALDDYARLRGLIHMSRRVTVAVGLIAALVGTGTALVVESGNTGVIVGLALWLVPLGALINLDQAIIRGGGRVVGAFAPALVIRPLLILIVAGVVWLMAKPLTASAGVVITLGAFVIVALIQARLVGEIAQCGGTSNSVKYERRRWIQVSAPLLLVAGFQIVLGQTDILLIGSVRGLRYAGLYSAASKTGILVGYLLVAFSAVAAPLFSELETKRDRAGLQRLATLSAQWVFWPTLLVAGILALLAPYVLRLFGHEFVAARGALLILLVGQLVSAGCGAVGYLLSMTGHQNDLARVYGVVSVANIAACYVGVRFFGLDGAAAATTVSLIIWNIWLHQVTIKRIGIRASIFSALALKRQGGA